MNEKYGQNPIFSNISNIVFNWLKIINKFKLTYLLVVIERSMNNKVSNNLFTNQINTRFGEHRHYDNQMRQVNGDTIELHRIWKEYWALDDFDDRKWELEIDDSTFGRWETSELRHNRGQIDLIEWEFWSAWKLVRERLALAGSVDIAVRSPALV